MRLLLDECVPKRLRRDLPSHEVRTVPEMGWAGKENGELLGAAEGVFDVLVTVGDRHPSGGHTSGRTLMSIRFNHTLVYARDKKKSATFLTDILGLPAPSPFGPFLVVELANDASLDFIEVGDAEIVPQHYAFLIDEGDFDEIFERIRTRGLSHWADPFKQRPDEINRNDGGRGVYFDDPDRHFLEVLTRPYGSGESST